MHVFASEVVLDRLRNHDRGSQVEVGKAARHLGVAPRYAVLGGASGAAPGTVASAVFSLTQGWGRWRWGCGIRYETRYIFGMFSPRDADAVLRELGSKFPLALVRATDAARDDLRDFRAWRPDWLQGMFQREVAGLVHARIWTHLMAELDGISDIELRTEEPFREARVVTPLGRAFKVRVKRHSEGDRISSYPTASDLQFWGGAVVTFEGLEEVPLAAGYRWQAAAGEVGAAVISYREGKESLVWAVEVDGESGDGVVPLRYNPILPELPRVDLASSLHQEESGT